MLEACVSCVKEISVLKRKIITYSTIFIIVVLVVARSVFLFTPRRLDNALQLPPQDIKLVSITASTATGADFHTYNTYRISEIKALTYLFSTVQVKFSGWSNGRISIQSGTTLYEIYFNYIKTDLRLYITTDGKVYYNGRILSITPNQVNTFIGQLDKLRSAWTSS